MPPRRRHASFVVDPAAARIAAALDYPPSRPTVRAVSDAAARGDMKQLRRLADAGPGGGELSRETVDYRTSDTQYTPMMRAAYRGRVDEVKRLHYFRSDVAASNAAGYTALHLAAQRGHDDVVKALLRMVPPPDIEARTASGVTPLMLAVRNHHEPCARLLLNRGASFEAKDARGHGVLRQALSDRGRKGSMAGLLIERGAREESTPWLRTGLRMGIRSELVLRNEIAATKAASKAAAPSVSEVLSAALGLRPPLPERSESTVRRMVSGRLAVRRGPG